MQVRQYGSLVYFYSFLAASFTSPEILAILVSSLADSQGQRHVLTSIPGIEWSCGFWSMWPPAVDGPEL